MKRLFIRLAGGYAGLGALAYLLHRVRYLSTSRLRDWTDRQARDIAADLDALREDLEVVREGLRARNHKPPLGSGGSRGQLGAGSAAA
ncbi:MAG TPA: hypothetical protein VFX49_15890 [Chloroflexota bacterium]|nr:hypothetical protein [Chloroflexota bacterium]